MVAEKIKFKLDDLSCAWFMFVFSLPHPVIRLYNDHLLLLFGQPDGLSQVHLDLLLEELFFHFQAAQIYRSSRFLE